MGAQNFIERVRAKSMYEAYKKAKEDAEEEYGHQQGYSGHINCTDDPTDVTRKYKESKLSLPEYIELMLETCNKRDCFGICIEESTANTNKSKAVVEHVIVKGTTKWILKYCVYEGSIIRLVEDNLLQSFLTKGPAVAFGKAHTEKTGRKTIVTMEKHIDKGSAVVARIDYKKSRNEKDGLYCLFGVAPS